MTWTDRHGTPVYRKSPDSAWPLKPCEPAPERDNVVPIKKRKVR